MAEDTQNQDDLQQKIEEAQKEADAKEASTGSGEPNVEELKNALARAMADLANYKRRTEEERIKFVKYANAELLRQIMPVVDNFDRSTQHLPAELKENIWAKGVVQIHDQLLKALEQLGVKKMKTVGEKLNPNLHDAVMQGSGEKDMIIEEFEPGYTLGGEVIKPAKVKVGNGE